MHTCIMIGYSEEPKSYRLFEPIKHHIIVIINVIIDENILGIKLLKYSSCLLHIDPFDNVEETSFIVPSFVISTS